MIRALFSKKKTTRRLTAVIINLRDKQSFKIIDFEDLFSFFDYLELEGVDAIKWYNYDPKERRVIITFPVTITDR